MDFDGFDDFVEINVDMFGVFVVSVDVETVKDIE